MFDKDLIQELAEYVEKNLKKGYTKESLKWALINQGYSKLEVEKSMRRVEEKMAAKAPILKTRPTINYEVIPVEKEKKRKWWPF